MRLAIAAAFGILPLGFSGCCAVVPKAENYFDRHHDVFTALCAIAYAIEAEQYDFAYQSLTPKSREAITFTMFKLAMRFGTLPEEMELPAGLSIRDFIIQAKRRDNRCRESDEDERHAACQVSYEPENARVWPQPDIFFEKDEEDVARKEGHKPYWRLDLVKTIRVLNEIYAASSRHP